MKYVKDTQNMREYFREMKLSTSLQKGIYSGAGVLFLLLLVYGFVFSAPKNFPRNSIVTIESGVGISAAGAQLKKEGVIRSELAFKVLSVLHFGNQHVVAGDYYLPNRLSVFGIASKTSRGNFGLNPTLITFPEGISSTQMAQILSKNFSTFDTEEFLEQAQPNEGYLFPDTYFFLPNTSSESIIETMRNNFDQKTKEYMKKNEESGRTFEEIIIMASILEKEAILLSDMRVISGLLWKRIDNNVRLQVDAPFQYSINKNTFNLTLEDLATDDPYNTYVNKGLPIGPIANPGLDSIDAAIYYEDSPYWFYLSDLSSTVHYSEDFAGHLAKKFKYLR